MAHGAPDDSNVLKEQDLYRVDDMGELAARLGSIVTYRRSGQVMRVEDFAAGLSRWTLHTVEAGDAITLQNVYTCSGGICPRLQVSALLTGQAVIDSYFPIWGLEKVSLQAEICLGANLTAIELTIGYYTGAVLHWFRLWYTPGSTTLWYLNSVGANVAVDTRLDLTALGGVFHNLKLTVDLSDLGYVRALVGSHEYNLSGLAPYGSAIAGTAYLKTSIGAWGSLAGVGTAYVDNIVITRGEI